MKCKICQSTDVEIFTRTYSSYQLFNNLPLCKCNSCLFRFAIINFDDKTLMNFYSKNHFSDKINQTNHRFFKDIAKSRLDFITNNILLVNNANILEVGAGNGYLLNEFRKKNKTFSLYATEPNDKSQEVLKKNNISIFKDLSKINLAKKFDLIIMSHVLEHVIDPKNFLKYLSGLLSDNGIIFVDVPCLDYLVKKETSSHISFFDISSLSYLFKNNNFEQIECYYCGPNIMILRFIKNLKFYLILKNFIYFFIYYFTNYKKPKLFYIWSMSKYSTYQRMWIRGIYRKI